MKVLIVSKALLSATYRLKLTELTRLGVAVTAVVPTHWREGGTLQALEPGQDSGYRLIVTPVRFSGHFHAHYYPELGRIMSDERPDLVHLDEEPYNLATFLGVRASRRAGLPSVFFTWQNINRRYPLPFRTMERQVYRLAAYALAGSEEAARVLRAKGFQSGIAVVPQFGVDPEIFHPALRPSTDAGPFRVGFLNRLVEAKGPMVALEALAALPPDISLTVVGDGPLRATMQAAVQARGLDGRVEMKGRVPSTGMPDLLRSLGAVILPSLTTPAWKEQFGRILIEAMACGVPVVGSDSGEIPHVIGDAGLIVPEGDASALATALRSLHCDAGLRADLAERGRARVVQHFTHALVARQTHAAYLEALAMRRSD